MEQDTVAVASVKSDDIYLINFKTMTLTKFLYFRIENSLNRVLNRRKSQHLFEIHLETYWVQRSLTTFLAAKSLLSSPYLDRNSFGLFSPFQPNIAALSHVEHKCPV
jgi:hypothetical protein